MSVRLDNGEALPSYGSAFFALFSLQHPDGLSRRQLARQLILRSVRFQFSRSRSRAEDEEQLSGFERGKLPLRVRPAFVVFNAIALVVLSFLGFHPRAGDAVPLNDKVLHFICFFFATGLFYFIWDIDEPARRVWIWRHTPLILTWIVCFVAGGLGSEIVQSALPYKTFQWGDVLANFIGSGLGLFVSYYAEKRHRIRREIQRLYEPLDQELYGDEDEDVTLSTHFDNDHLNDPWQTFDERTSSQQRGKHSASGPATSGANGTQTNGSASTEQRRPGEAINRDTLFSIEDDDEDAGLADAWKDAR